MYTVNIIEKNQRRDKRKRMSFEARGKLGSDPSYPRPGEVKRMS